EEPYEGLMVGNLWIYLPLAKEKGFQERYIPLLYEQDDFLFDPYIRNKAIDHLKKTGMVVLNIQRLMGGRINEGILLSSNPEADVSPNKFSGRVMRMPFMEGSPEYLRLIVLTAANPSLDDFLPIPLSCTPYIQIFFRHHSFSVK
ncbi:MAG: hypothetical protein KOO63_09620, partial [Bacteroidales bacterium]|nr:hypothetical protein [Candidatus Latescibacterota bacterium]